MKLIHILTELKGEPDEKAFTGQESIYAHYNVGWPTDGGITVSKGTKSVWSCSAEESKKLTSMGKIKLKNDTGLIRYLISIGVL